MADTHGYRVTGSRRPAANGWPDIGKSDRAVGSGLRDAGADKKGYSRLTCLLSKEAPAALLRRVIFQRFSENTDLCPATYNWGEVAVEARALVSIPEEVPLLFCQTKS